VRAVIKASLMFRRAPIVVRIRRATEEFGRIMRRYAFWSRVALSGT
jgi:hypothetical protein